jgi:NADP-dependent 3-hydroxy acid dehydrogenase YdfG
MRGRPGAMIATVSSVGGRHGIAGFAFYNATKFAVVGLHDALRKELGPEGIRVSLIEPGAVYTNWGFNIPKEEMKARHDKLEALQPQDIAPWSTPSPSQPTSIPRSF